MRLAGGTTRVPAALLSLGLALLAAALYWPATGYRFINYDDPSHLTANPILNEGITFDAVEKAFSLSAPRNDGLDVDFYIPLTWLSFMADIELWGASPRGFHLTNILLHAANMALLLLLLWRMTGSTWRSALAASLVALHPLRVESVAWITERKDVLSLFFLLLALAAYLAWTRSGKKRWYASLCALFACSLLSKPMAVTFPVLLLLLDFWPLGRALPGRGARQWLPLIKEKLPLFVASLSLALFTLIIQKTPPRSGGVLTTLFSRLQHAVTAPIVYLRKTVWPNDLALRIEYPNFAVAWGDLLVGTGAILLITWLAWRARRERPWALFGWGWFLVALAPASGLFPAGTQWIADRFTYLPHLGLMAAVAWSAPEFSARRGAVRALAPAAAVLCLLALAGTTRALLPAWKDTVSLFSRALRFSPDDPVYTYNLGEALISGGEYARAASLLRGLVSRDPGNGWGHNSLATALLGQGKMEEALGELREAERVEPGESLFHLQAGATLLAMERSAEAIPSLEAFLANQPDPGLRGKGLLLLGIALAGEGRPAEALPRFQEALGSQADELPARLEAAEALSALGRKDEAVVHWKVVAERHPGSREGLFARGRLFELDGRKGEAEDSYSQALTAPPADPAFPDLVPGILGRSPGAERP